MALGALSLCLAMRKVSVSQVIAESEEGDLDQNTMVVGGVRVYNTHLVSSLTNADGQVVWMIMLHEDATDKDEEELCAEFADDCQMGHASDGGVAFLEVRCSQQELDAALEKFSHIIDSVEPDMPTHVVPELPESDEEDNGDDRRSISSFGFGSSSWGLDKIGAKSSGLSGKGVNVYILDTGVRTAHSEFGGRAIPTLDLTMSSGWRATPKECRGDRSCAMDRQGHGTHCAGTVAGNKYGVAPDATIHAVKVLGDDGKGSQSWSVAALDWITSKGRRPAIASMSLGAKGNSRAEKVAIERATRQGITVVVAAGNENSDSCSFTPSWVPKAITVGATTRQDSRASYSNYGRCLNIYAPGSNIVSAGHNSDYASSTQSGTSMACPHVSGAAALLLQKDRNMRPDAILAKLKSAATKGRIYGVKHDCPNELLNVRNLR